LTDDFVRLLEVELSIGSTPAAVNVGRDVDRDRVAESIGVLAVVRDLESTEEVVIAIRQTRESVLIEMARALAKTGIRDGSLGVAPITTPSARVRTRNDVGDDLTTEWALEIDGTVLFIEVNGNIETGIRG